MRMKWFFFPLTDIYLFNNSYFSSSWCMDNSVLCRQVKQTPTSSLEVAKSLKSKLSASASTPASGAAVESKQKEEDSSSSDQQQQQQKSTPAVVKTIRKPKAKRVLNQQDSPVKKSEKDISQEVRQGAKRRRFLFKKNTSRIEEEASGTGWCRAVHLFEWHHWLNDIICWMTKSERRPGWLTARSKVYFFQMVMIND